MTDYYGIHAPREIAITPLLYGIHAPRVVTVFENYDIHAPRAVHVTKPGLTVYDIHASRIISILDLRPVDVYDIHAPRTVEIIDAAHYFAVYGIHAPRLIDVQGTYNIHAPRAVLVFDGSIRQGSALVTYAPDFWGLSVKLNGNEVVSMVTGRITIKCDENTASSCEFTLLPHGGLVDPTSYVNQRVEVSYNGHRRFTGFVDMPEYDPDNALIHFVCTDGLQVGFESLEGEAIRAVGDAKVRLIQAENNRNRVLHQISLQPALTQDQIDKMVLAEEEKVAQARVNLAKAERMVGPAVRSIVGGLWSASIFSSNGGWDAFHDCMSTQLASYNLDSCGNGVNTSWFAKSTPDFIFDETVYLDQSLSVGKIANARGILNAVDIKFEYRFTRLFEYSFALAWAPSDSYAWCAAYGTQNWGLCDHKRVADAITGAGYCARTQRGLYGHTLPISENTGLFMAPVQGPGWVVLPSGQGAAYLGDVPRFSAVGSFTCNVIKHYKQTLTETVIHTITAPQSVAQTGRMGKVVQHALESSSFPNAMTAQTVENWEEVVTDSFNYPVSKYGVALRGSFPHGGYSSSVTENVQLSLNRYRFSDPVQAPDNTVKTSIPAAAQNWDMTRNELDGRAERNNAFATAKAVAIKSIVESHRQNEVSLTVEAHETIEMSHTVRVTRADPVFDAKGKVKSLTHTYDMDSGLATTDITLALVKPWSTGVHYVDPYVPLPDVGTVAYPGTLFTPNLSTWPAHDYNLMGQGTPDQLAADPPDYLRFRGYNFFTGNFLVEAPPTPQEASPVFNTITRTNEVVTLPDDLFAVGV